MLLGGEDVALVLDEVEGADEAAAGRPGEDDVVDVALLRGDVGVGEELLVLLDLRLARRDGVGALRQLAAVEDVDRAFRAHDGDLGRRPGVVEVGPDVLGGHDAVGAAVGLARDDGDLRDGRLGEGEEELGAVPDDPAELLLRAGEEAGDVLEGDERDVEGVAEADEARPLRRGVDVEDAGEEVGLVRDDADRAPAEPREADDEVLREVGVDLEELAVVDDAPDQLLHVVGLVRARGDEGVEGDVLAVARVRALPARRVLPVVGREEAEEGPDLQDAVGVRVGHDVGDAGDGGVGVRSAERLLRHLLVRHRLDDVGAGDEHRGGAAHHQDEVGDGGRVDGAARAGAHDGRDLRDDAGGERVAQEDVGVAGEGGDPFLDPRAARVVQADDRRARLHREVHHLADLRGVRLGEGAAEDGEVLREDEDGAPLHADRAGDDAVARDRVARPVHAEVAAPVDDEGVGLLEGARVAEKLDALARRELARPRAASSAAPRRRRAAPPAAGRRGT